MASKPRILIARAIPPEVVRKLEQHFEVESNQDDVVWSPQELARHLQDKDGVLTRARRPSMRRCWPPARA